jgi:FdrA protein
LAAALRARGGVTVASVCGTELDPQPRDAQIAKLRAAGVVVARSNATAARGDARELPQVPVAPPARPAAPLFGAPLAALNIGLDSFADTLDANDVPVTRVEWKPPAGGDEELARILERLL